MNNLQIGAKVRVKVGRSQGKTGVVYADLRAHRREHPWHVQVDGAGETGRIAYAENELEVIEERNVSTGLFAALSLWCNAAVASIALETGEESNETWFRTESGGWLVIGDWWCFASQCEGGIDCTAYDLSTETLQRDYGFEVEDQQKVIQVVKDHMEAK